MSLAFDEYGRPFIIIKEGATKGRLRGIEAQKAKKARMQPPVEESRQTMTQFQTEKAEAMHDISDHLRMLCGTSFKVTIETINA